MGRGSEERAIERLLSAARGGRSGTLLLVGEPGIGKSSLLERAVGQAEKQGTFVLRAFGSEQEQSIPFAGLHQLLVPALPSIERLPAPHGDTLAVALGLRGGQVGGRFAVGVAALGLLTHLAEQTSLLVAVDDVHHWDTSSAEALAFVARRLLVERVAVVASSRHEESPLLEAGLETLPVRGLDLAAVQALLVRESRAPVSPELARRLHSTTRGNPLAVVELARDVDALNRISPEAPLPVPEAIGRSFVRRVAALDAATQRLLLVAAVADGDLAVTRRAVSAPTGPGGDAAVEQGLAAAERAGLVRLSPGRVAFQHPLLRAAVHATAEPEERRRTHRTVAHALPEADLERRAWHLAEATIGVDDAVADLLDTVGARCDARGAHAVSATAHERAALLASSAERGAPRFLAAARAAWLAGQGSRAEALLTRAIQTTADPALRAESAGVRGDIALRSGSLEDARSILTEAAADLAASDPDAATTLLCDVVLACLYLADTSNGLEAAARIDALLDRCTSDRARVQGNLAAGMAQVLAGEVGGSLRIAEAVPEMMRLAHSPDDALPPAWMVVGPLYLRESEAGRSLAEDAVADLRRRSALVTLPKLLLHTARHDATTERWEAALAEYDEGITLARETGQSTDLTVCLAGQSWLQARMGREEPARRSAAEALELAQRQHVHFARIWASFALGDLELALGHAEKAVTQYEGLLRFLDDIDVRDVDLSPEPELVEALCRLGRGDEAASVASSFLARAQLKSLPWSMARAERANGLVGGEAAEAHFLRALELHEATPDAFEQARTQLAYGAVLRRGRRRRDARPLLRSALATFDRVGAHPWTDAAATELAATGETPSRRGQGDLDRLTAQEMQIARLLGNGSTTRAAAAAMFLSPKTVEYHLRHVYEKLGIGSRAELSSAVMRR